MLARSSQSRTSAPATVTVIGRPDASMLYNTGESESLSVHNTPPASVMPLASGTAARNCARPTCSQPLCGSAGAAQAAAITAAARSTRTTLYFLLSTFYFLLFTFYFLLADI